MLDQEKNQVVMAPTPAVRRSPAAELIMYRVVTVVRNSVMAGRDLCEVAASVASQFGVAAAEVEQLAGTALTAARAARERYAVFGGQNRAGRPPAEDDNDAG